MTDYNTNTFFCDSCFRRSPLEARASFYKLRAFDGEMEMFSCCQVCVLARDWKARAKPFECVTARDLYELWLEQNGRCAYCKILLFRDSFHIDHVYPKSKGGPDVMDNFVFTCVDCNCSKNSKTLDEWQPDLSKVPSDEDVIENYNFKVVMKVLGNADYSDHKKDKVLVEHAKVIQEAKTRAGLL